MPPRAGLTVIIVVYPGLDGRHLDFQIDLLNRQSDGDFNTFWLDQHLPAGLLARKLAAHAQFKYLIFTERFPVLGEVVCWDLISCFARYLEHPDMRSHWTYLHMECLPDPDFVRQTRAAATEISATHGSDWIGMLVQLRCPLTVTDLHPGRYLSQLQYADLTSWTGHWRAADFEQVGFAYWEQPWQEDAFVMPRELSLRLRLFEAVRSPLYFQDLFDVFPFLYYQSLGLTLRWFRISQARIYHLHHPRLFQEYSPAFLARLEQQPELFGHLNYLELVRQHLSYQETATDRQAHQHTEALDLIYRLVRFGVKGTATLWYRALLAAHQMDNAVIPYFDQEGRLAAGVRGHFPGFQFP
jgi:hypothetical protein